MLKLSITTKVYLSSVATDMRCGVFSLSGKVLEVFEGNSLDGNLYVFISKDKKKVKILHWEEDGYWLHQKRLGVGTFQIRLEDSGMDVITGIDLEKLLSGISFAKIKLSKNIKNNLAKSPLI